MVIISCGPAGRIIIDQNVSRADRWRTTSAAWTISDSLIAAETRVYDDLLTYPVFIPADEQWTLEVQLKGERAGVFFSLDDTLSKPASQMVRFDGKMILAGHFNGGGDFKATSVFPSPSDPHEWTDLRIDVHPQEHFYSVFVNSKLVGTDSALMFRSGYVGLQASAGTSSFRAFRVSETRNILPAQGPSIGHPYEFAHIRRIEAHGNRPCVFDPRSGLWVTLDDDGTVLRTHTGTGKAPPPVREAVLHGRTFTLSGMTMLIQDQDSSAVDSSTGRFGSPECIATTDDAVFVADSKVNAVLQFDDSGAFVRYHTAKHLGGFIAPRGIAALENGTIAVADYDKIVIFDPDRPDPSFHILYSNDSTAFLQFDSELNIDTVIVSTGGPVVAVRRNGSDAISLGGLLPNTTYSFQYAPALRTIPPSVSLSRRESFTTPPEDPTLRQYRQLDLLYLIYRTISYRDVYPRETYPNVPDGRTLTDDEIAYLYQAANFNTEFFFRNSGCRLLLHVDISVIEDTLWLSDVGASDPYWLEPNERVANDVRHAAIRFGKEASDYDGTICTYAWMNYPPRRTRALHDPSVTPIDTIRIRQAYGGGTYGVPAPWTYGTTSGYTGNPFQDRFSRQDWLITHEFHHQLDALMAESGYPEYYHADQPWKMPGVFGEDFSFNAAILRSADPNSWLSMTFGTLRTYGDLDGDGVPDDDPALPFDEKRLGSSAEVRDTDGDGLTDLEEATAGTEHGTSLFETDTDGDGLWDAEDPEPLYSYPSDIGIIEPDGTLQDFADTDLGGIRTTITIGWTEDSLAFEVNTSEPANLLFQLDANNDGWFHGFDNLQMRVRNERDSVYIEEYYLRDCSSWTEPPRDRKDILQPSETGFTSYRLKVASLPALSSDIVRFAIPSHPAYGMAWHEGKAIGIRIGVQTEHDRWVWDELFERNDMMTLTLR